MLTRSLTSLPLVWLDLLKFFISSPACCTVYACFDVHCVKNWDACDLSGVRQGCTLIPATVGLYKEA